MKRTFPLRVVLSVTTGRLLTKPKDDGNGISDLYELLGFLCGESPFTHQLPRFADDAKPWLLRWFPELEQMSHDVPLQCLDVMLNEMPPAEAIEKWLSSAEAVYGLKAEYELEPIPRDNHTFKDPIQELAEMVPGKTVIVQGPTL